MVIYHSFTETLVSKAAGVGRPQIRRNEYGGDNMDRKVVAELSQGVKHPPEWSNFAAISSNAAAEARRVGSHQRVDSISGYFQNDIPEEKKSVSSIILNPHAIPFVSKPIDWGKVPLRTSESSFSLSPKSESYDQSIYSMSDDVTTTFCSSDGMFSRQSWASLSVSSQRESFMSPRLNRRYNYPMSYIDSYILQDSYNKRERMETADEYSQLMKKQDTYNGKKCYHCGCVGHMAKMCPRKQQGLGAVCFLCDKTGHKYSDCPLVGKTDVIKHDPVPSPRRSQKIKCSTHDQVSNDSSYTPKKSSKRTRKRSTKENERKKVNNKKLSFVSQIVSPRVKNHSRFLNRPDFKTNNSIEQNSYSRSPESTMGSYSNKICYEARALAQINENDNMSNKRYVLQKLEDRESQLQEMSNFGLNDGETDNGAPERGASETVSINMIAQGKIGTAKKWNEVHQMNSFQEALTKALLISFQTETIKVLSEMSFNYYLGEDVYAPIDSSSCDSTGRNQWTINDEKKSTLSDPGLEMNQDNTVSGMDTCGKPTEVKACLVFEKGVRVGAVELLKMLSRGIKEVQVHRKPRVAVFSFGNQLTNWDSDVKKPHNIIDSCGPVLEAMVRECGAEIIARELYKDENGIQKEILMLIEKCDMILMNGDVTRVLTEKSDIDCKLITRISMESSKQAYFASVTEPNSRKEKIVFGLPGSLHDMVIVFHLLVKPSLKRMMGSLATPENFKSEISEDLRAVNNIEEYYPAYFQEGSKRLIVPKNTNSHGNSQESSLIAAKGIVDFSTVTKKEKHVVKGAVAEVDLSGLTDNISNNLTSNKEGRFIHVGIVTVVESARKHLATVKLMIQQLFSSNVWWTVKHQSKNLKLMKTLVNWTTGSSAKQLIFTMGGVSHEESEYVQQATKRAVDRELPHLVEKLLDGYNVAVNDKFLYQGAVGICQKTLIVNLPEQVQVVEHCLQKLKPYVETIVYALEK